MWAECFRSRRIFAGCSATIFRPADFHFLEPAPPECDFLIVALGSAPYIFVSAQIVHEESIDVDGQTMSLMGCRFVARIKGVLYGHRLGEQES